MLSQLRTSGEINISNYSKHLSGRQELALSSVDQYIYAHDTIAAAIECGHLHGVIQMRNGTLTHNTGNGMSVDRMSEFSAHAVWKGEFLTTKKRLFVITDFCSILVMFFAQNMKNESSKVNEILCICEAFFIPWCSQWCLKLPKLGYDIIYCSFLMKMRFKIIGHYKVKVKWKLHLTRKHGSAQAAIFQQLKGRLVIVSGHVLISWTHTS